MYNWIHFAVHLKLTQHCYVNYPPIKNFWGVSIMAQWLMNPTRIHDDTGQSLDLLSGLRIQCSWARGWIGAAAVVYATVMATLDPSHICDLCFSLLQCQILNSLSEARDQTHILTETILGMHKFPDQRLNLGHSGNNAGSLTARPPGNSLNMYFLNYANNHIPLPSQLRITDLYSYPDLYRCQFLNSLFWSSKRSQANFLGELSKTRFSQKGDMT